jgi:hypothetical protein
MLVADPVLCIIFEKKPDSLPPPPPPTEAIDAVGLRGAESGMTAEDGRDPLAPGSAAVGRRGEGAGACERSRDSARNCSYRA